MTEPQSKPPKWLVALGVVFLVALFVFGMNMAACAETACTADQFGIFGFGAWPPFLR